MQFLKKLIITVTLLTSLVSFSQAETSWITKKKDKSKKVEKVEKINKTWIKKKEIKENKKKAKEKLKKSKSWITKKSDEKVKDIKKQLKKHKSIEDLPKAEYYFAAIIEPRDNENAKYVYGYVNSDKSSDMFKFNNSSYYSKSDGIGYFEDGNNSCEVDSKIGSIGSKMMGEVILNCKKNLSMSGWFIQTGNSGKGEGETTKGNSVKFKFYTSKIDAVAQIENFKLSKTRVVERQIQKEEKKKILLDPKGKYYALLIGNSIYDDKKWDELVSPVNDINSIKKVLDNSYKFEKIITVPNATKKQIFSAFKELSKLTTDNDYVLIYYSGHGKIKATQAYWIPRDGTHEWGESWINVNELNIFLTEIKAHHLAVMVDSCYVGGKFKGTNILDLADDDDREFFGESLSDALNLRARSVLSSGSTGRVSDTAPNSKNSVFALAFLNVLSTSEKMSSPLNMWNVAMNVKRAFVGNFNQKPYYYHPDTWYDGGGDFIFIPKANLKK